MFVKRKVLDNGYAVEYKYVTNFTGIVDVKNYCKVYKIVDSETFIPVDKLNFPKQMMTELELINFIKSKTVEINDYLILNNFSDTIKNLNKYVNDIKQTAISLSKKAAKIQEMKSQFQLLNSVAPDRAKVPNIDSIISTVDVIVQQIESLNSLISGSGLDNSGTNNSSGTNSTSENSSSGEVQVIMEKGVMVQRAS